MANQVCKKPLPAVRGPPGTSKHPSGSKFMCKTCMSECKHATNTSTRSIHCMVTRGISASFSRNAVFNTPELMENVLIQMNAEDLTKARRVDKAWNAIIMTSPRIQRKLFLLAEPEKTIWTCDHATGNVEEAEDSFEVCSAKYWTFPAKLNHMLFTRAPGWVNTTIQERMKTCEAIGLVARPKLALSESIYHRMLLSQPPTRDVQLEVYFGKSRKAAGRSAPSRSGTGNVLVRVKNSAGVRFIDVLHEFYDALGERGIDPLSTDYVIKLASTTLWMGGVVFTTDEEAREVKKAGK